MSVSNVVDSSGWLEYFTDSHRDAATVRHAATLWTQDEHFKGLPNVRYFPLDPAASGSKPSG